MSQSGEQPKKNEKQYTLNMVLAAVTGQVGCLTSLIVVIALIAGLWLDNSLQTRPTFTILFVILSVPITLVMMVWVVRKTTSRITSASEQNSSDTQE
jgi:F0F1-type ATP synthase assembly protein I